MPEEPSERGIVVRKRGGGITEFSDRHRSSDPLHFVLLHPFGQDGWHTELRQTPRNEGGTSQRITCTKFYKYHMMEREGESDALLRSARLFQEWISINFGKTEQQRLSYIAMNQDKLRSDVYQNVVDCITETDAMAKDVGRKVILPVSHIGSKRDRYARFQDAKAVMRKKGPKADLFVTVTTNTKWKEITEVLKPGQLPQDRPDIVASL